MTPDSTGIPTPSPAPNGRRNFLQHLSGLVLLGIGGTSATAKPATAAANSPVFDAPVAVTRGATAAAEPVPWEELCDPGWSQ